MTPLHVCAFAYHFTGKERDQESGLDFFGARYYASSMGRFMSPDWSDGPDPAPYASLNDPQSLKLYSYGGNNPLSNVDDDGHVSCYGQSQTSIFSCISTFFHNLFGGGGGSGSSAGVGGASHGDVPSAPDYWPNDFGRQVSMELGRRAPGALGIINYQAQNAVDEIGAIGFGEGGGGAIDGLSLNRFSEAEIEIAVEGAAAPRGLTTTGRSALQSHAERVGGRLKAYKNVIQLI